MASVRRRGAAWELVVDRGRDPRTGRRRHLTRTFHDVDAALACAAVVDPDHPTRDPRTAPARALGGRRFDAWPLLVGRSHGQVAELVGVSRPVVVAMAAGRRDLDEYEADRWAVALGRHPAEVWPEWLLVEV